MTTKTELQIQIDELQTKLHALEARYRQITGVIANTVVRAQHAEITADAAAQELYELQQTYWRGFVDGFRAFVRSAKDILSRKVW